MTQLRQRVRDLMVEVHRISRASAEEYVAQMDEDELRFRLETYEHNRRGEKQTA